MSLYKNKSFNNYEIFNLELEIDWMQNLQKILYKDLD